MVASEVAAGIGAFKAMLDIAKTMKDLNDAALRNAAVIELQGQILTAQMEQSSLIQKVGELEAKVRGFETWEAEKQRYKLDKLPPGVLVRTLKPEAADGEPAHHICENCYQNGRKSPLHQSPTNSGIYHLKCNGCGSDLRVGNYSPSGPSRARGTDGGWMGY